MHLDEWKQKDGSYIDQNEVHHDNAQDFIMAMLGFCGCGRPEDALKFLRDSLKSIDFHTVMITRSLSEGFGVSNIEYCQWKDLVMQLFCNEGIAYFTYYVLEEKGLTEHGVGVPGWLTKEGKYLLEDLNELLKEDTPQS